MSADFLRHFDRRVLCGFHNPKQGGNVTALFQGFRHRMKHLQESRDLLRTQQSQMTAVPFHFFHFRKISDDSGRISFFGERLIYGGRKPSVEAFTDPVQQDAPDQVFAVILQDPPDQGDQGPSRSSGIHDQQHRRTCGSCYIVPGGLQFQTAQSVVDPHHTLQYSIRMSAAG